MAKAAQEPVGEIRITDPYIVTLIANEQNRTGEKSSSKVAARLISERVAIREVHRPPGGGVGCADGGQPEKAASAA